MKHKIAQNRSLIVVDAIKKGSVETALNASTNGTVFIKPSTGQGDDVAITDEGYRVLSKFDGKIYQSFGTIRKKDILYVNAKEYKAPVAEVWEATPTCQCSNPNKTLKLEINISSPYYENTNGAFNMGNNKFYTAVDKGKCNYDGDCETVGVYKNHLLVRAIYAEYLAQGGSEYYTMTIKEGANALADLAAVDAFIATNKAVNTDANKTNNSKPLTIVLTAKIVSPTLYRDLDVNYVYPRGIKLNPVFILDEEQVLKFTQTTKLVQEIGSGYDLKDEERSVMSLHTDLKNYPTLIDGTPSPELVYQVDASKKYHTVTVEYKSPTSLHAEDYTPVSITFATTDQAVFTKLKTIFTL